MNVGVNISIIDSPIELGPFSITWILPKIPKNTPLLNTNTGHNPAAVTYLITLEYHLKLIERRRRYSDLRDLLPE